MKLSLAKYCICLALSLPAISISHADTPRITALPEGKELVRVCGDSPTSAEAVRSLPPFPGWTSDETLGVLHEAWNHERPLYRLVQELAWLARYRQDQLSPATDDRDYMFTNAMCQWFGMGKSDYLGEMRWSHFISYFYDKHPRKIQSLCNLLALNGDLYSAHEGLALQEAMRGTLPRATRRLYPTAKEFDFSMEESIRLWSDPVGYAPYIMSAGSDRAKRVLRAFLHDHSALSDIIREEGVISWKTRWGIDLPKVSHLAMKAMDARYQGDLPSAEDLSALAGAKDGLRPGMEGLPALMQLAVDPTSTPWKALDDPQAALTEMPDCSAVTLPQWDDSLMGTQTSFEEDCQQLQSLLESVDADKSLVPMMIFSMVESNKRLSDRGKRSWYEMSGQDVITSISTFDLEVTQHGMEILIDKRGPRFARNDAEMRRRCRDLNIALHRCMLKLAILERDDKTEEARTQTAKVATLVEKHHGWPLIVNEYDNFTISPSITIELIRRCKNNKVMETLIDSLTNDKKNVIRYAVYYTGEIEPNKFVAEATYSRAALSEILRNRMIFSGKIAEDFDEREKRIARLYEHDRKYPGKGLAMTVLYYYVFTPASLVTEGLTPDDYSGSCSFRGYALVQDAVKRGDLEKAEELIKVMTSKKQYMTFANTRFAMALVARAKGDEEEAKRQEAIGMHLVAIDTRGCAFYRGYLAHRSLWLHDLLTESERLMLLPTGRDYKRMRETLALRLADQRKFESAAFQWEYLLYDSSNFKASSSGQARHASVVRWRVRADAYRALSLLRQGKKDAARRLLEPALKMLEGLPMLAGEIIPHILTCADLPQRDRLQLKARFLSLLHEDTAAQREAKRLIGGTEIQDLPTVDEPAGLPELADIGYRPFISPMYEWHLGAGLLEEGKEAALMQTADGEMPHTVKGSIIAASYEEGLQKAWVQLRLDTGRVLKVKLSDLAGDDLRNLLDWQKQNGIRAWKFKPQAEIRSFTAKLVDVAQVGENARAALFMTPTGVIRRYDISLLDAPEVDFKVTQPPQGTELRIFPTMAAAETYAEWQGVPIRACFLGRLGSKEEADFRRTIQQDPTRSREWNSTCASILCYQDEQGNWDATGQAMLQAAQDELDLLCPADVREKENWPGSGTTIDLMPDGSCVVTPAAFTEAPSADTLKTAAQADSIALLKQLLDSGIPANTRDATGGTLLGYALATPASREQKVQLLLEYGADPNQPFCLGPDGYTYPLFLVAGDAPLSTLLRSHGADINRRNYQGEGVIAGQLHLDLPPQSLALSIQALKKAGADINAVDAHHCRPLMTALNQGNLDAVRILLENGANATPQASDGDPFVIHCAKVPDPSRKDFYIQSMYLMLKHGADVNSWSRWDWNSPLAYRIMALDKENVQKLISMGADPHGKYNGRRYLKALGIESGKSENRDDPEKLKAIIDMAEYLIGLGVDVQESDPNPRLLDALSAPLPEPDGSFFPRRGKDTKTVAHPQYLEMLQRHGATREED